MLSTVASFVSSLTGKVALGTALAAASVGTAHAAHVGNQPGPRPEHHAIVGGEVELDAPPTSDTLIETTTTAPDDTTTTTVTTTTTTIGEAEDGADAPDEPTDGDATEPNHGQVVSEFAHTTDLEGCERGQAIADLASGGRSSRNAPLDNCAKADDGEDDGGDEPAVTPTESSTSSTKTNKAGKGGGRDRH